MATCTITTGDDGSLSINIEVSAGELVSAGLTPGESATVTTEDVVVPSAEPTPTPSNLPGE